MNDRQLDEEKIFHIARGLDGVELRADYLTQICAGDQALRERVETLLEAHETDKSLLKSNVGIAPTADISNATESVGEQIGRYRLLQKIGEGGFGVVYLAEQSRPVRRKVALKVIKPGMDTAAVVARFEAERQALALMDHLNIAKVFDGGATESGRPYFVMELVKGVPITQFCDENKFNVRQRLELLVKVCRAIQHAHQKGIIHRDIKPANVLVTLHDGEPIPKVIDFGISKAISQQLTEKTLFTAHGQMIGTPQYMSPEQAEMSGLDIDTRSDIYSIGILLYELLTGSTPLDPKQIRETAYADLQRMIREDEPPTPSRRLSEQGKQSVEIANQRDSDPRKLCGSLRGELDWIVMKTLEKDRNRRYETPSSLAGDIEHYLHGEAVNACPPSLVYRLQKFTRKHRVSLVTGGVVAAALLLSTIFSSWWAIQAETAKRNSIISAEEAKIAKNKSEAVTEQLKAEKMTFHFDKALNATAAGLPDIAENEIAQVTFKNEPAWKTAFQGWQAFLKGNAKETIRLFEEAHGLAPKNIIFEALLADAYLQGAEYRLFRQSPVVQLQRNPQTPHEEMFVGNAIRWIDYDESIKLLDNAVEKTSSPLSYAFRARSVVLKGINELDTDLIEKALEDAEIASKLQPGSAVSLNTQVWIRTCAYDTYQRTGDFDEANRVLAAAAPFVEKLSNDEFSNYGSAHFWIGHYYLQVGDTKKAFEHFAQASYGDTQIAALVIENPDQFQQLALDSWESILSPNYARLAAIRLADSAGLTADEASKRAEAIIKELNADETVSDLERVLMLCEVNALIGRTDKSREYAQQYLNVPRKSTNDIPPAVIQFYAGKISADDYIKQGEGKGMSEDRLYTAGLFSLGSGKEHRTEAIKYFGRLEKEGIFHTVSAVGIAMLKRMIDDPQWPHWLNDNHQDTADNSNTSNRVQPVDERAESLLKMVSTQSTKTAPIPDSPRVKNFYSKQAIEALQSEQTATDLLPEFPGIDGPEFGHWGNYDVAEDDELGWNQMELGGLVSVVTRHFEATTTKAVCLQLGQSNSLSGIFDPERLSFTDVWKGGLPQFQENRFGVQGAATVQGEQWVNLQSSNWLLPSSSVTRYQGFHRHDHDVLFKYQVDGTNIEDHGYEHQNQFYRSMAIKGALPESTALRLLSVDDAADQIKIEEDGQAARIGEDVLVAIRNAQGVQAKLTSSTTEGVTSLDVVFSTDSSGGTLQLAILRGDQQQIETAKQWFDQMSPPDLKQLSRGSKARWASKTVTTKGVLGDESGAYAIDTLTVPYRDSNPFGTPFRLTGFDFLPDGRAVVSTLTGDIWLVSGVDETLKQINWKRIAAGLHQPLGLLVQDGRILVGGRDQITCLHDLNGDDEVDFYECVTNQFDTVEGHNFVTCLQQDRQKNLYFSTIPQGVFKFNPQDETLELLGHGMRYGWTVSRQLLSLPDFARGNR